MASPEAIQPPSDSWFCHFPVEQPWWWWFSHSVVSDSLKPHRPQHAKPPYLSPTPGVYPNSCPLSRCCHPTISSSVVPVSSCPQSFPASESFQMSQLFASGGQSTGVSASIPQLKSMNSSALSFLYSPTLTSIHDYWKNHNLD